MSNYTGQSDSTLVGLFSQSKHSVLLTVFIFVAFLMALFGNSLLILLMLSDTHLHTPMYFFISQLSLMDMMYISVTVPKMLLDQVLGSHKILTAWHADILAPVTNRSEFLLLAAMSYDCYVAICHPLWYPVLMNLRVCLLLMSVCWLLGSLDGFMLTPAAMTIPFCGSQEIYHFFCEAPAVTKLSCSDTWLYETVMYVCCVLILLIPVTVISDSYSSILLTVLRINSAEGRKKALAPCSSHMTVVILFYGAAVYTYMLPASVHTLRRTWFCVCVLHYSHPSVEPTNLYSLRNNNVTEAMKKFFGEKFLFPETVK